jgi:hypothetical protein
LCLSEHTVFYYPDRRKGWKKKTAQKTKGKEPLSKLQRKLAALAPKLEGDEELAQAKKTTGDKGAGAGKQRGHGRGGAQGQEKPSAHLAGEPSVTGVAELGGEDIEVDWEAKLSEEWAEVEASNGDVKTVRSLVARVTATDPGVVNTEADARQRVLKTGLSWGLGGEPVKGPGLLPLSDWVLLPGGQQRTAPPTHHFPPLRPGATAADMEHEQTSGVFAVGGGAGGASSDAGESSTDISDYTSNTGGYMAKRTGSGEFGVQRPTAAPELLVGSAEGGERMDAAKGAEAVVRVEEAKHAAPSSPGGLYVETIPPLVIPAPPEALASSSPLRVAQSTAETGSWDIGTAIEQAGGTQTVVAVGLLAVGALAALRAMDRL